MNYFLPDKLYTALKWLCLLFLPAVSWLYMEIAPDWGFPMAEQVCHTIDAVAFFIGVLIGASQLTASPIDFEEE